MLMELRWVEFNLPFYAFGIKSSHAIAEPCAKCGATD